MKRLSLLCLTVFCIFASSKAELDGTSTDHFISYDILGGNMRTFALYYGYSAYNLNSTNTGTHLLTIGTSIGYFENGYLATPNMPPVSTYVRYIVGNVVCFELEAGAVIGAVEVYSPEFHYGNLKPKYSFVDYPVGFAWSVLLEPFYLRVGGGLVYSELDHIYISFALGVAL